MAQRITRLRKYTFGSFGVFLLLAAPPTLAGIFSIDELDVTHTYGIEPAMENMVEPLSNNDIRDIMIKESIAKHGFCACPYSTDALGGQCGTLSAYYDPWRKILCYRRDISNEDIYFFRLSRARNAYTAQQEQAEQAAEAAAPKSDKEKKNPTANYFRNSAQPLNKAPKTLLPANSGSATTSTEPTASYFINSAQPSPSTSSAPQTMPYQGFTDLVAPPTPTSP